MHFQRLHFGIRRDEHDVRLNVMQVLAHRLFSDASRRVDCKENAPGVRLKLDVF